MLISVYIHKRRFRDLYIITDIHIKLEIRGDVVEFWSDDFYPHDFRPERVRLGLRVGRV